MKVLLRKTVAGVGHSGDVKDVADGYARNYLLPRGLAVAAGEGTLRKRESERDQKERQATKQEKQLTKTMNQLSGHQVFVERKASDTGTLYAAVTAKEVSAILEVSGFLIPESAVALIEPLKHTGTHRVPLRLSNKQEVFFVLHIAAKP